jgi:hypothetical protein
MGRATKFREESTRYKPSPKEFRKYGESTHGEGRHHAHGVGDRVSYRVPKGRETGTVIEKHKEFYIVSSGNDVVKVNRNSILYSLGTFVGGMKQMADNTRKAYEFGKQKEDERLEKFKTQYGKFKARPKITPKKKTQKRN